MGEEGAVFVERVKGVDCRLLMAVVALSDEAVPYRWRQVTFSQVLRSGLRNAERVICLG